MESAVKGQFYEYYCYNELIKNTDGINIIKAHYVKRRAAGNFIYSPDGKIIYYSSHVYLAEFDVIGIKEKTIYWWEITRGRRTHEKEIKRKQYLLKRLFGNYEIVFCLILPKIKDNINYDYKLIEEPNYEQYFKQGYFQFDNKISKCIPLEELEKLSTDYDYVDEIISMSFEYFDNYDCLGEVKRNYLIEKLYNINKIKEGRFEYYDISKNNFGEIEIIGNKILFDGQNLTVGGKTRHEIDSLLKRLEYSLQ
jgi:hypothetical protein